MYYNTSINYQNTYYIIQFYLIIKNMNSIQYRPSEFFEVNFNFAFYSYDPNTKLYNDPVCHLIKVRFNTLNLRKITVAAYCRQLMGSMPTLFPGFVKSPDKYLVHHIPPLVFYPSNPSNMNISDVIKRYKESNPSSDSMMIVVNVIQKYEEAINVLGKCVVA